MTETPGIWEQMLLFLLAGAVLHGFWLVFLFLRRAGSEVAYRLLAVALASVSLHLITFLLFLSGFILVLPHALGVTYPFVYLTGPAFYFFICYAVEPDLKIRKTDGLHVIPFLLIGLLSVRIYTRPAGAKLALIGKILANEIEYSWSDVFIDNSVMLFTLIYVFAAWRKAGKAEREQAEEANRRSACWLKRFCMGFMLLLLLDQGLKYSFFALHWPAAKLEYLLATIFALAFHLLGYHVIGLQSGVPGISREKTREKYRTSPLNKAQLAHHREQLIQLMTDKKPFLDPQLKITTLAAYLEIPSAYLSQLLNEEMHTTFYDFINLHRINAVKEKLEAKEYAHYSLLAIALDSGFSNKTTFNRAFKKFTGMTPSEFATMYKAE